MNAATQRILVEHNLVAIPGEEETPASCQSLVTILSNIAYYGFGLSEPAYAQVSRAGDEALALWWTSLETALRAITGDDKEMSEFVVYKNFPAEVIAMDEIEYWSKQILMYWGFPNELLAAQEEPRDDGKERLPVKILHPAAENSLHSIRESVLRLPARWTPRQWETICELCETLGGATNVAEARFKENMVLLATLLFEEGREVSVATATDVLRLAAGLSDGDISLREPSKLRRFTRPERRFLLRLLESTPNLLEDVGRRRGQFKRLFRELRPGDYKSKFPNVVAAYDVVYRGAQTPSHNRELELLLANKDPKGLATLKTRPGDFLRRLRVATRLYGRDAADAFVSVLPRLTTTQLLKIECYLRTINQRQHRTFPPKGNWAKLRIEPMTRSHRFDRGLASMVADAVAETVSKRVSAVVPSVRLSAKTKRIRLQGNDSDLAPYGRGTVFPIPNEIRFLRSASYWESGPTQANLWYDNSWNFFDKEWAPHGVCCWNRPKFHDAAVFSGDPTNSKDLKGRACQLIDLYLGKLKTRGVRFAIWNILCYSNKSFDDALDVQAALQWGEKPQQKKLFEPSRVAFSFPVGGPSMTKYVAYIDLEKRELVFIDANLYGRVQSAAGNGKILSKTMPAFLEYVAAQPTVHDLFKNVPQAADGMPVLYDDADTLLTGERAYVFAPKNRHSEFEPFALDSVL